MSTKSALRRASAAAVATGLVVLLAAGASPAHATSSATPASERSVSAPFTEWEDRDLVEPIAWQDSPGRMGYSRDGATTYFFGFPTVQSMNSLTLENTGPVGPENASYFNNGFISPVTNTLYSDGWDENSGIVIRGTNLETQQSVTYDVGAYAHLVGLYETADGSKVVAVEYQQGFIVFDRVSGKKLNTVAIPGTYGQVNQVAYSTTTDTALVVRMKSSSPYTFVLQTFTGSTGAHTNTFEGDFYQYNHLAGITADGSGAYLTGTEGITRVSLADGVRTQIYAPEQYSFQRQIADASDRDRIYFVENKIVHAIDTVSGLLLDAQRVTTENSYTVSYNAHLGQLTTDRADGGGTSFQSITSPAVKNPVDVSVAVLGQTATFSAPLRGVDLENGGSSVWQYSDDGTTWVDIAGEAGESLNVEVTAESYAREYRRAYQDDFWNVDTASEPARMLGDAPTITAADLPAGLVGAAYVPVTIVAAGQSDLVWSVVGLPAGLTFDPATGELAGTPTAAGQFSVVVTVTDAFGSATETFSLTVTADGVAASPGNPGNPDEGAAEASDPPGSSTDGLAMTGTDFSMVGLGAGALLLGAIACAAVAVRRRWSGA